ncbi:hypothetical protein S40288_02263 [Stachybotrys chartarum IBT 40288]|nr:hypothetical protein S40288_02263 [Stachybotrys chartarum IBT 40288]
MTQNILITGAAGFIGGSLIAEILARTEGPLKNIRIFAAAREQKQIDAISKLDVTPLLLDITETAAVDQAITKNKVNIVVHNASAWDPRVTSNFIKALGKRRRETGDKTFYLHTSVTATFAPEGGWPYGEIKDSDPSLMDKQREIPAGHPVRGTNIALADEGKEEGVTVLNLPAPMVYGRGRGEWRKVSINIPALVRAATRLRMVRKFEDNGRSPAVHVDDLTDLYALLLEKIIQGEELPSGESGYYFAFAHKIDWWKTMDGLAKALHARGLVDEPTVKTWPSWDVASEELKFPRPYIKAMGASNGELIAENGYKVGWQPKWDEKRFMDSLDDEVQAVLELDTRQTTVFDALI